MERMFNMDFKSDKTCLSCPADQAVGPRRGARKKVLIVDDEYLIRYAMQKLMEDQGYSAFTAGCGDDALRQFSEQKPDIVILDIHLPDINGLALLKTIKEISPSVSVIMATGCPDVQSSEEAMKMGALDYIAKPVSIDTLKTLMHATNDASMHI